MKEVVIDCGQPSNPPPMDDDCTVQGVAADGDGGEGKKEGQGGQGDQGGIQGGMLAKGHSRFVIIGKYKKKKEQREARRINGITE